jgi:glycolate oxidase FAD binding subunit
MTAHAPSTEAELVDMVRAANADGAPLRLLGAGSKGALGRPPIGDLVSLAAFAGLTLYEPEELVLSARAATPRAEIEALLDAHGQQFAFEPVDYGPLLGAGLGTMGGLVATGGGGPRRIKAGALRDYLLGFRCVTGRGDVVKSGGRVMKNVTGYDLSKLVAGSYGTLAALTEVTLKVLPKAESEATALLTGLNEGVSLQALRDASRSACEASGLAMLPARAGPSGQTRNLAAIRLEGPPISLGQRLDDLRALLGPLGGVFETLSQSDSAALWRGLRDAEPVAAAPGQIWRVSLAPTDGGRFVEALKAHGAPILSYFYDWAGGLVWLRLEEASDAHAATLRAALEDFGGHATLIRAAESVRAAVDVFQPQAPALAALSKRVKASFDPAHVLERGRMRAEF